MYMVSFRAYKGKYDLASYAGSFTKILDMSNDHLLRVVLWLLFAQ